MVLRDIEWLYFAKDVNKLHCEACYKRWDKKSRKRANLVKIDKTRFSTLDDNWALVERQRSLRKGRLDKN